MKKSTIAKIIIFKVLLIAAVVALVFLLMPKGSIAAAHSNDTDKLYQDNCAECHNAYRLGGMGPALLPENLKRLRKKAAVEVIKNGRVATQMPAFKDKLNDKQIQALVDFVYTPLKEIPTWGMKEIKASQIIHNKEEDLPNKPVYEVDDLLNMFLVVELGDHHVTLLDGDKLEPIHRFRSRSFLHGGILPRVTAGSASTISTI